MSPAQFRAWRKRLFGSQRAAADALGLSARTIALYEAGEREGREVVIPKAVRLAMASVALGVTDYDGG